MMEAVARKNSSEDLASRIRESAETSQPVETTLATSERIIARVTDGIYREPWAAFRELIANAYDADATSVIVETGVPDFRKVTVRDDGNGMSADTVAYILRSIGGSSKRTQAGTTLLTSRADDTDRSPGGRPLIGKIGIGLFAVAQLTQHFQIITTAKGSPLRISATVRLKTHDEDRLKDVATDDEYVAGNVTLRPEKVPKDEIDTHGTSIVLYDLRPEIRKVLQSVRRWEATLAEGVDGTAVMERPSYHIGVNAGLVRSNPDAIESEYPWNDSDDHEERFRKLFHAASRESGRSSKPANLEHFDEYLQLIWKLSLSLPLEYIDRHPFELRGGDDIIFYNVPDGKGQAEELDIPDDTTLRDQLRLHPAPATDFSVLLDGIKLSRPVNLPKTLQKQSRIGCPVMMVSKEEAPFTEEVLERAGGRLVFEGYLYWNSKIIPKDTAGVLLRVRDASGTLFDPSFLNYQVSEQTRLRQITAEIFVHEGLDSAINIDRESFNYSHPHFLYIQRWLHKALRLLVNRLKARAVEDLQRERDQRTAEKRNILATSAMRVWNDRLGASADPPVADFSDDALLSDIGGTEIEWGERRSVDSTAMARAIAVVLEAYGVLSALPARDRAALINDILKVSNSRP